MKLLHFEQETQLSLRNRATLCANAMAWLHGLLKTKTSNPIQIYLLTNMQNDDL